MAFGEGLCLEEPKKEEEDISMGLFREMPETTMRLLKLIIRKANLIYKSQVIDGHEPDFRITLCFEAAKYFKVNKNENKTYFDYIKISNTVSSGNIFSAYLLAMLENVTSIYQIRHTSDKEIKELISSNRDFEFIERLNNNKVLYPSYPWKYGFNNGFGIADFYRKY